MTKYVHADPYAWPYNGDLRPQNTVFLVIDMQSDFCGLVGYVDKMGYDLSLTRPPHPPDPPDPPHNQPSRRQPLPRGTGGARPSANRPVPPAKRSHKITDL